MTDFKHVDDLVDTLRHAKINADVDPGKLRLPGVWVQVTQVAHDRLDGYTFTLNLALIAPDRDVRRAMTALGKLLDAVRDVIPTRGPAVARSYLLPETPTPLPGLAVPFNLRTKKETP